MTTDFHASRTARDPSSHTVSGRDGFAPNNDGFAAEGRSHKSGHGRSNSTIDTLATIALATSPTFGQLPFKPPSPNNFHAMPLFPPESVDTAEPPAKRARSDKNSSPYSRQRPDVPSDANHSSFTDSMKVDAELLLNLARPNNPSPTALSTKRTSMDVAYPYHGNEPSRHPKVGYTGSYTGRDGQNPAYTTLRHNGFPPTRVRSQSDGSTINSRPVIHGMRPNTSSSTLPPVTGNDGDRPNSWNSPSTPYSSTRVEGSLYDATGAGAPRRSIGRSPKVEDETDSDSDQTSCAACHLVRIATDPNEPDEVTWISCDGCKQWFHIVCAGFKNDREVRIVDRFICRKCRPIHGQTTFVRKSSRARTAIDYAGLNQGLVKASADSLEHHYIEPIRQGKIRFLPDNFPRMHPDLVSAEYFERGIGMTEPVVIPAHLNQRGSDFDALVRDAPTNEMFDELLEHQPETERFSGKETDCGQDRLGMVIPEGLTVRTIAELYGPEERVEVIDVKSQQGEDKRWNMQRWADYYESTGEKVVRNVISLEVSHSKLGRLIRRPKLVRDLDLQGSVWPDELKAVGDFPNVQLYCLMSVADCYTDFHIDFGGSSVFYTILKGKKTFFFIPPKEKYLKKYEEWCNSPAQDNTFLGDQTKECYRVDLSEGDTMLIPSGWIHAVWTPENSLVIGGNFLTRLNYGMQIKIAKIEKDTKVPRKFRYPFFQKVQWYAALKYLEDDPVPPNVLASFMQDENYRFHREYPVYYEFGENANNAPEGSSYHNSRFYSQAELEGLPELVNYLLRTALIAGSYIVEGVTMDVRNAIKRSIPKGVSDPVDTIRMFGVWVAWKRGNEQAPSWTRPGVIERNPKATLSDKKPAGRPSRRSERNAGNQRMYVERHAVQRFPDQPADFANGPISNSSSVPSDTGTPAPGRGIPTVPSIKEETTPKPRAVPRGSGLGPKRVACDACRKRRIKCRHKDEQNDALSTDQAAIHSFGPGIGVQSQSALAHDAATALNSLAAIASEAGIQDGAQRPGFDRFESTRKFSATTMDTPIAAPIKPTDISPDGINSGKKGRSKACDDCRKSKVRSNPLYPISIANRLQRRCIHDEYGRVDPVKAQERSKPRGTISTKRARPNDEDASPAGSKKPKQESISSPSSGPANLSRNEGEVHTQAGLSCEDANEVTPSNTMHPDGLKENKVEAVTEAEETRSFGQTSYASPPAFHTDAEVTNEINSTLLPSQPTASLVSPPTSLSDEADVPHEHGNGDVVNASSEREHPVALHTPSSNSRHSSRQPRQVDRYAPDTPAKSKSISHAFSARHPPSGMSTNTTPRTAPAPSSTMRKPSSRPTSSHAKKPTTEKTDRQGSSISLGQPGKNIKHDQAYDNDTDPESLRLIREIQEQEFGLRKRGTRI